MAIYVIGQFKWNIHNKISILYVSIFVMLFHDECVQNIVLHNNLCMLIKQWDLRNKSNNLEWWDGSLLKLIHLTYFALE